MQYINGTHIGNLEVSTAYEISGMIKGDIVVEYDGSLILNGMVIGSILVKKGGVAEINGTVKKDVTNDGGSIVINGVINGRFINTSGEYKISPDAIISGGNK